LKVPSLREGHAVSHSDQDLVKQVLNGGDGMPAFKDKLSPKEAADLIKYIRREFQIK
jgi:mono/diheme cytochrome c family protein